MSQAAPVRASTTQLKTSIPTVANTIGLVPKRDLVDISATCTFCGNNRGDTLSSCEGCGASSVDSLNQAKMEQAATDSVTETTRKVLEDAQKSRLYLTGTALLFAVLFGMFWQKSQPSTATLATTNETIADINGQLLEPQSPPYSEHALMLASVPAAEGVFEQKAIFSSAMIDISYLNVMIHEHYLDTGNFPSSLLDLNLVESSMISRNVSGLQIESEGVINVQLTDKIGNDIVVRLIPELIMGGSSLQWNCLSNLPPRVLTGTYCEST